jgi:hypothetical protein
MHREPFFDRTACIRTHNRSEVAPIDVVKSAADAGGWCVDEFVVVAIKGEIIYAPHSINGGASTAAFAAVVLAARMTNATSVVRGLQQRVDGTAQNRARRHMRFTFEHRTQHGYS